MLADDLSPGEGRRQEQYDASFAAQRKAAADPEFMTMLRARLSRLDTEQPPAPA